MSTEPRPEILEVLDCDIGVRPKAAPGIPQLLPHVLTSSRDAESLTVDFDPAISATLEAFVEAERTCCANIGWLVKREEGLRLRITASEEQLTLLENLWKKSNIEKVQ